MFEFESLDNKGKSVIHENNTGSDLDMRNKLRTIVGNIEPSMVDDKSRRVAEDMWETQDAEKEAEALKELESESIDVALTDSGKSVKSLGLSSQEWDSLSEEEKVNLKKCN